MNHSLIGKTALAVAFLLAIARQAPAQGTLPATAPAQAPGKELLVPPRIYSIPDNNDYKNNDSEYSFKRMASSENFALFWAKEYGDDPSANPDARKRVDIQNALKECERFYTDYMTRLKFVDKDKTLANRYKFLIFVTGGSGGTAFGGDIDNKIGALWTPASRISRPPYGALAHELGHSFQAILHADGAYAFSGRGGGTMHEMTSQYMLWQVYPEWMTFENYHLVDFMKKTHLAFLHEDNQYHSPYVLEYWSCRHGVDFVGKLWRESRRDEDPVVAYKRVANLTQAQFNDEIFDAARRFVTWDMPRIDKVAARYANQHTCRITAAGDGWHQIAPDRCPQNYGYNAIKLKVPPARTKITLDFKGVVGAEGFRSVHPERAGWRYGFVASMEDGSRTYGETFSKAPGTAEFTVPANTKFLWLVVTGAPAEHWEHLADRKTDNDEQWPYQFKLTGTSPDDSVLR